MKLRNPNLNTYQIQDILNRLEMDAFQTIDFEEEMNVLHGMDFDEDLLDLPYLHDPDKREVLRKMRRKARNLTEFLELLARKAQTFEVEQIETMRKGNAMLTQSYNYEGLSFMELERRYLFDTSSTFSIGYGRSMLGNIVERVFPDFLDTLTTVYLEPIRGVLGVDQIREYRWHYIPAENSVKRFKRKRIPNGFIAIKLNPNFDLPIFKLKLNENIYQMIIDTSSKLSYIRQGLNIDEMRRDIDDELPIIGRFTTIAYPLMLEMLNHRVIQEVLELPKMIDQILPLDVDGLIGFDFLQKFEWILDLNQNTFWVKEASLCDIQ
jgi:hypothetical protein